MKVAKSSGDQYRAMARQLPNLTKAIELLKQLVPGNDEALDGMMASYQARVEQAKSSVKRKKLVSGILGEKFKTSRLLKALNNQGWSPKFQDNSDHFEFRHKMDEIVTNLSDNFDIEVSVDDLVYYSFFRDPDTRSQLYGVNGVILPNGQIYVEEIGSDKETAGPYLLSNVAEFVSMTEEWLDNESE